jgi:transcriptional regulator with XRE-family HTH domain
MPRLRSVCNPDATGLHSIAATVAWALLRYRDRYGLTQGALARKCGISRGRYNRIEGGEPTGITVATLMRLADGCETTPDGLLGFAADPAPLPGIFVGLR